MACVTFLLTLSHLDPVFPNDQIDSFFSTNPLLVQMASTLQKQVGCFNHRVVALVADKLEGQWSLEVCFDVED